MKILVLTLLLASSTFLFASDWKDVTGIYAITPEDYLDPPPTQAPDTHFRLQLTGDSARDLYNAMSVEPIEDECTGGMAKSIQQMKCLYFAGEDSYECHFSINIAEQKIEYGIAC
jgi:hypothetical protein